MTVSTELSHEEYVGNGVTTDFDFRFRIFEGKHLIVVVADSDGNETTLKNGTDYTIVGVGSYHGGKVVLNKPLVKGWKILLERDLPVVQETDLRNQGKFFAEVHEDAFDYLTMLIQKALGFLSLCLRKPSYLSKYYDAKKDRIENLGDPKKEGDATNKKYVDAIVSDSYGKTLRVRDKTINTIPDTKQRSNKILAFDDNGQPITIIPSSGSASDVLIELAKEDSSVLIAGKEASTLVKETNNNTLDIRKINKRISSLNPSIPSGSNSIKLIMRSGNEKGFNIISKKARGRGGYIRTTVRPDVATADDFNLGGQSNWRPNTVTNITKCYVGNTVMISSAGGVTQPELSSTFVHAVYGLDRMGSGSAYYAEKENCSSSNLQNPKLYSIPRGGYAEFYSEGDTILRLGMSKVGSDNVSITIRTDSWTKDIATISTKLEETQEPVAHIDVKIQNPILRGGYTIRVMNKTSIDTDIVYVAGCNIIELSDCTEKTYFTNAIAYVANSPNNFYRKSNGANEFAIREKGGKFFGTFHGGHTPIIERLRCERLGNYDVNKDEVPKLLLTEFVSLYSASELVNPSETATYNVISNWVFCDGSEYCKYNISLKRGKESEYDTFYTHMNTTDVNFNIVLYPTFINNVKIGNNPVGDTDCLYQQSGSLSIYSLFSKVIQDENYLHGANIQSTSNFNKQYYGPCMGGGRHINTLIGDYVTYKEFF